MLLGDNRSREQTSRASQPGDGRLTPRSSARRDGSFGTHPAVQATLYALPACLVYLAHAFSQRAVFIDDAWIFYRYAVNWAQGLGPIYNAGERVEGYSSLLWTAMLAGGSWASVEPERLAPILALLSGCGLCVALAGLARALLPAAPVLWAAVPLAVSLCTGLASYAVAGMDTVVFAAVLSGAVLAAVTSAAGGGGAATLAASLGALILVRAEGLLYSAALLGMLGWLVFRRRAALSFRSYLAAAAVAAAVVALQFGGRWLYYGEWVPATVSAKAWTAHTFRLMVESGFSNRTDFLEAIWRGLDYQRFICLIAAIPVTVLLVAGRRPGSSAALVSLCLAPVPVNVLLIVLASGDWMPLHRLSLAVWPLLVLLLAWSLHLLLTPVERAWRAQGVIAAALLCAGLFMYQRLEYRPAMTNVTSPEEIGRSPLKRQVGEALARIDPPARVITSLAGKMPYYAGVRTHVVDLLGLTDRHNAKQGDWWFPAVGRSDFTTTYARPFDLLVTNSSGDLIQLVSYWEAHPGAEGSFGLLTSLAWVRTNFYVVVDRRHPIAAELERMCGCTAEPLTRQLALRLMGNASAIIGRRNGN